MRLWIQSLASLSGLDLVLLWLWRKPAAIAPIQTLDWELPYATGAALKKNFFKELNYGSSHRGAVVNESD